MLVAFEPEEVTLTEEVSQRLDATWDRLRVFVKKTAQDAVQLAMALVKSHNLEADLVPVGEGVGVSCTDAKSEAYFAAAGPLAERIMDQVSL